MNLHLIRKSSGLYGIFGELYSLSGGERICYTLEHAYIDDSGFMPKVAPGIYTCVRHPPNRLHYETWLLENVPVFQGAPVTGILIHRGNWNADSIGCILVGLEKASTCILESEKAFDQLMALQNGCDSFTLMVE